MTRPLLLIDIDGVLNPWGACGCPEGFREYQLADDDAEDSEPVRLSQAHGDWLRELGASFDLVWASAWGFKAHRLLGPILGLDEFPHIPMPRIPFRPAQKVPAISAYIRTKPAAWIDDVIVAEARSWAAARDEPTLLIEVDHRIGMTRCHVDQLLRWARTQDVLAADETPVNVLDKAVPQPAAQQEAQEEKDPEEKEKTADAPSSSARSTRRIRSGDPAGERTVPAVARRFEENPLPELVVAAGARDPDVSGWQRHGVQLACALPGRS